MRSVFLKSAFFILLAAVSADAQRDTAFTWSRRLPEASRLSIRNHNGMIDVRAGSTDRVEVRATIRPDSRGNPADITFEVRESTANDVEICTVYRGVSSCEPGYSSSWNDSRVSVRYVVDIPKGLRLRANTGNGDVIVMQSVAEIDIATGNGDVVVRESMSRAVVSTGNGDVTVAAANGPVRVSTGNGQVTVNTSAGPVDASSGNGDLSIRMTSVPQGTGQASMAMTTGNGSISVTLPGDFSGEVDASTGNGNINSDFDLRVQGRIENSRLRGTIGTGNGPLIKIRSGHGRLELRKG